MLSSGWLDGSVPGGWAVGWEASSLLSSSKFAQTPPQGHGKGPREKAEAASLLKAEAGNQHSIPFTPFCWPNRGQGQPRAKGWGNRLHLLLETVAKSHCENVYRERRSPCIPWSLYQRQWVAELGCRPGGTLSPHGLLFSRFTTSGPVLGSLASSHIFPVI